MTDFGQDFFEFVATHRHADTAALRLKYAGVTFPFPLDLVLTQIDARRKAGDKLAPFFENERFLVPTLLSAEQATDWRVARHHAAGVKGLRVLDLTAGLGIDAMTMAGGGADVTAVEIEESKCEILKYNANLLGLTVTVINGDANEVIRTMTPDSFDVIYIDPARRDSAGRRTYAFADCQPDVTTLLPSLLSLAPTVIIKTSPLLDLSEILRQVTGVTAIEAASVRGEVKEVLVRVSRDNSQYRDDPEVTMTCMNSAGTPSSFPLRMSELGSDGARYATDEELSPGLWLCEPDAALMKCAPWGALCATFPGLKKISRDTHLFVSREYPEDFPGRVVRILSLPDKRSLKSIEGSRINVATRNYPGGTDTLRKRLRLTDGGADFIYGFRTASGRPVITFCSGDIARVKP